MWSILAGLYPVSIHPERINFYQHPSTVFEYDDIEFPIKLGDITKFENNNILSVNVFTIEYKKKEISVAPLRITKRKIIGRHFNLLLFSQLETDVSRYHYVLIKSMSRLLTSTE